VQVLCAGGAGRVSRGRVIDGEYEDGEDH